MLLGAFQGSCCVRAVTMAAAGLGWRSSSRTGVPTHHQTLRRIGLGSSRNFIAGYRRVSALKGVPASSSQPSHDDSTLQLVLQRVRDALHGTKRLIQAPHANVW